VLVAQVPMDLASLYRWLPMLRTEFPVVCMPRNDEDNAYPPLQWYSHALKRMISRFLNVREWWEEQLKICRSVAVRSKPLLDKRTPGIPHGRTKPTHCSWTNQIHTLLMDEPTPHTPHGRTNSTHSSWTNQLHTLLMDEPNPHTPHGRTKSTYSSWTNQLHTLLMDEPTPQTRNSSAYVRCSMSN